ncbi:MAG: type II toxin-antitoxin system VapC family toxin [Intrasporangium sp.]|uniref:type II toxin-antitoxin system VapC family toxin n=1 Tax=Intrasporangium sp. TaxID=1925024 RepID=UPI00264786AE|nr:type II toxin-antitoxin system VapC family toxin [Intrasporangium sp.]MDN5795286.1 type II toxin-antitoxin system VapC family toxin [Intrasporangium sp.]
MSDDYVLDASALTLALIGKTDAAETLRQRLPMMRRHAPHLVDAEVGNVLRRHERRGRISAREGEVALAAGRVLIEHRYPHAGALGELAWTWRANLSFYDALYVALAVKLGVPLLTADSRLASSPHLACTLEMV